MIELFVEPGVTLGWDEFIQTKPPYSIALDGYVRAESELSTRGPYLNLDHHTGLRRMSTRSTCAQVYLAIMLGLFRLFQRDDQPHANVYVNDCDQDVCLSYWLLRNPDRVVDLQAQDRIARLIIGEDFLDATAGSFPLEMTREAVQQAFWIFEPYTTARSSGELKGLSSTQMGNLITSVCERIDLYVAGKAESIEADTQYELVGGGSGWVLAHEIGGYARVELYRKGVQVLVAYRDNQDGTYTYSIGKISGFVQFPIKALYGVLNQAEGLVDPHNQWGGSDMIGGSPRQSGSRLKPKEFEQIVNSYLARSGQDASQVPFPR